jgi:threonyl-tRNA synthetase
MLIAGDRDIEAGAVSVRTRANEDLGAMAVAAFREHLVTEVESVRPKR